MKINKVMGITMYVVGLMVLFHFQWLLGTLAALATLPVFMELVSHKSKLPLLAILLFAIPAGATTIEDSNDRLMFNVSWTAPNFLGSIAVTGDAIGTNGSTVRILEGTSSNPYLFIVEVHRMINGSFLAWQDISLLFRTDPDDHMPLDARWGTPTAPRIALPDDHLFAVAGNDHGVRVVVGALPVPEGCDTMTMMLLALLVMAIVGRALEAK